MAKVSFCTKETFCYQILLRFRDETGDTSHLEQSFWVVLKLGRFGKIRKLETLSLHRAFCSLFNQYTNKCTHIHLMIQNSH